MTVDVVSNVNVNLNIVNEEMMTVAPTCGGFAGEPCSNDKSCWRPPGMDAGYCSKPLDHIIINSVSSDAGRNQWRGNNHFPERNSSRDQ